MAKEMISAKKIAERWGVTGRRINQLCNAKEIKGAIKVGGRWKIPFDVEKSSILRSSRPKNCANHGKLLPCQIGISSYKEVSFECYYVDKTLLIKDLIDDHSKVTLLTRPRRFATNNTSPSSKRLGCLKSIFTASPSPKRKPKSSPNV